MSINEKLKSVCEELGSTQVSIHLDSLDYEKLYNEVDKNTIASAGFYEDANKKHVSFFKFNNSGVDVIVVKREINE